jgi:hypothetical protein
VLSTYVDTNIIVLIIRAIVVAHAHGAPVLKSRVIHLLALNRLSVTHIVQVAFMSIIVISAVLVVLAVDTLTL